MYTKRIQIVNYGPIDQLDILFPFEGETPKPVVLVGENGSGKSIFLSHIVNGLTMAKDSIYPETPEIETGKVFKVRTSTYIKSGADCYFVRVDFEQDQFLGELRSRREKRMYKGIPLELSRADAETAWNQMGARTEDHLVGNIWDDESKNKEIFSKNCVLYFPHNRFEEPAWLNEENLNVRAEHMDIPSFSKHTSRRIIDYSPLRKNQNWLYDVVFDRQSFEIQTVNTPFKVKDQNRVLPVFMGHAGNATNVYNIALQVVQKVLKHNRNARFGIGRRHQRVVSLEAETGPIVPNIFQLSSGETSLLNLFLSILRDFDMCQTRFDKSEEVRGIVVVDEVDLHLHTDHQYLALPALIGMFPNVQFVLTTHSPLFVLGMNQAFGEDGFAVYRLPQGSRISPEEFSEFERAYQSFTRTSKFADDMRTAVKHAQKPVVFVDGETDVRYLERASELLNQKALLGKVELRDGGGSGNLGKIWKTSSMSAELMTQKVVLLHDCDDAVSPQDRGNFFRRTIPMQRDHPIKKGVENLFEKAVLERAREYKDAFIDIDHERTRTDRGKTMTVPEEWTINANEKTNLCAWLCEEGREDDFQHFEVIFKLLQAIVDPTPRTPVALPSRN